MIFMAVSELAFGATGGTMPWETPLQTIKDSLTGPTAGYIALVAIFICGAILIFGGDISGFARTLINVVLACAVMLGASSIVTNLFPSSGAVIKRSDVPGDKGPSDTDGFKKSAAPSALVQP